MAVAGMTVILLLHASCVRKMPLSILLFFCCRHGGHASASEQEEVPPFHVNFGKYFFWIVLYTDRAALSRG